MQHFTLSHLKHWFFLQLHMRDANNGHMYVLALADIYRNFKALTAFKHINSIMYDVSCNMLFFEAKLP